MFYVVNIGETKLIEETKTEAIKRLVGIVSKHQGDIENLQPEIIEVNTSEEKWQLKGLAWNTIAMELMRQK